MLNYRADPAWTIFNLNKKYFFKLDIIQTYKYMEAVKDAIISTPGNYPSVTIGVFIILIVIIIYMYWKNRKTPKKETAVAKKKAVKTEENDDPQEDAVDDLIDEIKTKQKA